MLNFENVPDLNLNILEFGPFLKFKWNIHKILLKIEILAHFQNLDFGQS